MKMGGCMCEKILELLNLRIWFLLMFQCQTITKFNWGEEKTVWWGEVNKSGMWSEGRGFAAALLALLGMWPRRFRQSRYVRKERTRHQSRLVTRDAVRCQTRAGEVPKKQGSASELPRALLSHSSRLTWSSRDARWPACDLRGPGDGPDSGGRTQIPLPVMPGMLLHFTDEQRKHTCVSRECELNVHLMRMCNWQQHLQLLIWSAWQMRILNI